MKRLLWSCLAITAIALIAPRPAVAASLVINDALSSENITFSMNDFEGGFVLDGTLVQQGLNNAVTVTVPEANAAGAPIIHTFRGEWITPRIQTPDGGGIAFAEAGINPALGVSDILTFTYSAGLSGGVLEGTFESDVGLGLLPLPVGFTVVLGERFDFSGSFPITGITAIATSDESDVPSTGVPEPSTFLLLGSGFAGLAATRRWRHRHK